MSLSEICICELDTVARHVYYTCVRDTALLEMDFGSFLFTDTFYRQSWRHLAIPRFQFPPQIFYRIEVWRVDGRDFNVLPL